ncbi:MAG: LytTR family DNA-binding domain-containing protein [Steroidobacteraceae bacterium]
MLIATTHHPNWRFAARFSPAELFYWFGVPILMALHLGWHHAGATSLLQRIAELGYFSGLALMGWGSLILCTLALFHVLRPLRPKPWALWLGGALLTLLVFSYPKMIYIRLSDFVLTSPFAGTSGPFLSWPHITQALASAPPGIIAWMTVNLFYDRVLQIPRFHYPAVAESAPQAPAFLRGLEERIGPEEVLAIEACDHYIRIHTGGRTRILHCRFGDAVGQMARQPGAQVHRSYWVAAGAMKAVEKHKHGYQLELANGARVPVSRTHLKDVKQLLESRAPGR